MRIIRIEVEGGFLNGLDLEFAPGLNVLIGSRGVGKTSVLELLRFGLGAPSLTSGAPSQSMDAHALAVLGDGQVTLTIEVASQAYTVTRTANQAAFQASSLTGYRHPLVLAQGEIERVALHEGGRLNLLDSFIPERAATAAEEQALLSEVASLTTEARTMVQEISLLLDGTSARATLASDLADSRARLASATESLDGTAADRQRLDELSTASATLKRQLDSVERSMQGLGTWARQLRAVQRGEPQLEDWPEPIAAAGDSMSESAALFASVRHSLTSASTQLGVVARHVESGLATLQTVAQRVQSSSALIDREARGLHQRLNELSAGAGSIAKKVADLEGRLAQLDATRDVIAVREARLKELGERRRQLLDDVDQIRRVQFERREAEAASINAALFPQIQVRVVKSGGYGPYVQAVIDAFRGTGIQYNVIAPEIAQSLSPRELVELVESRDSRGLSARLQWPPDRADRFMANAVGPDLSPILTTRLEDAIEIELMHESVYKGTSSLSTGQRCTAVLPVLLMQHDRVLVIDQPEDNLDNGYIVETLVAAIAARGSSQLICATHNPNIPVLGDAAKVTLFGSDGRRGYKLVTGKLDDEDVVDSITTVMEGGREAFARRASFYARAQRHGV